MCNLVVPIRTCSRCKGKGRLFEGAENRDNEKRNDSELLGYMDPKQDCYSRWCIHSSEHPKSCSHCWLTCRRAPGKIREIQGGSSSYVCYNCEPRERRPQTWKPPRPMHSKMPARAPSNGFVGVGRLLSALAR